jgi:hypothetical protein
MFCSGQTATTNACATQAIDNIALDELLFSVATEEPGPLPATSSRRRFHSVLSPKLRE